MVKRTMCYTAILSLIFIISIRSFYTDYTIRHRKPAYYITYEVQSGDCVDEIAERYKPEYMRLENYRTEIQVLNNTMEMIYPGTQLRLPIYEN